MEVTNRIGHGVMKNPPSPNDTRDRLAATIRSARLRTKRISRLARRSVGRASRYVRQHSLKEIISHLESSAGEHPGASLMGAVAVGFLVGRTFRGKD